jgi:hypothetical protein
VKTFYKLICGLLISSMVFLPFTAHARLVSTEQATTNSKILANHEKVNGFLSRSEVISKFEELGLTKLNAQERVNAMTQEEIDVVANKSDSLPAGGSITETGGVIIGVTLIIVIALITQRN